MEVSQFTYFQQVARLRVLAGLGELTYGLERLAMYVQGVENVYDLNFNGREGAEKVTYGDVFLQAEQEYSRHNFEHADTGMLFQHFKDAENECMALLDAGHRASDRHSWPCRPMTSASRPATSSTCSMRAASSRSPSARATSCACANSPRPAAQRGLQTDGGGFA